MEINTKTHSVHISIFSNVDYHSYGGTRFHNMSNLLVLQLAFQKRQFRYMEEIPTSVYVTNRSDTELTIADPSAFGRPLSFV